MILLNFIYYLTVDGFQVDIILSWIIPIIFIAVIWYVIIKVFLKKRFQKPGDKEMLTGKREIELSESGIKVWTPISESVFQWAAVTKLEQSTKNYFLYLGQAQAVIISKSAFENEIQKKEFEEYVFSKISS